MLLMKLLLLMLALCFPRTEPPRLVQKSFTLVTVPLLTRLGQERRGRRIEMDIPFP